jgi:hypothetical protein
MLHDKAESQVCDPSTYNALNFFVAIVQPRQRFDNFFLDTISKFEVLNTFVCDVTTQTSHSFKNGGVNGLIWRSRAATKDIVERRNS